MQYTNVKEMTEEVNKLIDILENAKTTAILIAQMNARNAALLRDAKRVGMGDDYMEKRPLNLNQRIKEADSQREFFWTFYDSLIDMIDSIGRNY